MAHFFDVDACEELRPDEKTPVLEFEPQDFFERDDHDFVRKHVIAVEGWTFAGSRRTELSPGPRGAQLVATYGVLRPEWTVPFRAVLLPTPLAFLGLLVSTRHIDKGRITGYSLSGPRDV
jgi:hypothetical protein